MGIGLSSALNTASMGIKASEKMINVIGNNLANANTVGFKAERADFADFLSYTYSLGAQPENYNAGTNPIQIGMGVVLTSVSTNFNQGAIKDGMTSTDLAISGGGFFVVRPDANNPTQYYTRNGVFKLNANQQLVNTDGNYVMGYTVNDKFQLQTDSLSELSIPLGKMKIAEATQNVSVSGILNAIGPDSTQGTLLQSETLTDLSKSSPGDETASAAQISRPSVENSATSASGADVSGSMEEGDYVYRFVYARETDSLGQETDYSTPIAVSVAAGENGVTIDNLPLAQVPTDSEPPYTLLRVYRAAVSSDGTATDFYRVDDIPLASAPSSYTDTKATADIVDPAKQLNLDRLNGDYQYVVTYTNSLGGESRPSVPSTPVTVNNGRIQLSDIPVVDAADNPDNWTGRNVYRQGADGEYFLVASIPNMDANVTVVDSISDANLSSQPQLNAAGSGSALPTSSTKLVDLGQELDGSFVALFKVGTLSMTANKGDTELQSQNFQITENTTVGEYLKFLSDSMGIQSGGDVPLDQGELAQSLFGGVQGAKMIDGKISILGNSGTDNALKIVNQTITDAKGTSKVSLNTSDSQTANGTSLTTSLTVYDSLGAEVNVRLTFALESKTDNTTTYRWYADSADNQPASGSAIAVGSGTVSFDSHGKLVDSSNTAISVLRTDVASVSPTVFQFNMDLGSVAALATGAPNVSQTAQDGAAAGVLTKFSIGENGIITGVFDSGASRTIGQVLLATFANQEGLTKIGDNLFAVSMNSGAAIIGTPSQSGYGKIIQNSIESSNTDIGSELIDMILASSMYRANTKIITTSNEMFDTLLRGL